MLLIVVDAYSKWIEVKVTPTMTSSATIRILDDLFATYDVPITLVSDNGTNFTSEEFSKFLKEIGVKYHKRTAAYHPSTNGQAERNVQTVKNALKMMDTTWLSTTKPQYIPQTVQNSSACNNRTTPRSPFLRPHSTYPYGPHQTRGRFQ